MCFIWGQGQKPGKDRGTMASRNRSLEGAPLLGQGMGEAFPVQRAILAPDWADFDEAAREAEARRMRANVIQESGLTDLEDRALGVEHRRGADGVWRPYLVNEEGAITVGVRPGAPTAEDWATIDAVAAARERGEPLPEGLAMPPLRREGVGYAEDGFISDAEMARRRQAVYGDPGTGSIARSARVARLKRQFAQGRAYGNGPSEAQEEARERWDAERSARARYPSERNARLAMAEASRRAEADRAYANREHAMKRAQLEAETAKYGADAQVRAVEAKGLSDQRIAEIQQKGAVSLEELRGMNAKQVQELLNSGNLAVAKVEGESRVKSAEATAAGVRDAGLAKAQSEAAGAEQKAKEAAQKRGMELMGLAMRIQNGGKDENLLSAMDMMVDANNNLTAEEKARRKAELRNGGDLRSFLPLIYQQMVDAFGTAGYPMGAPGGVSASGATGDGGQAQLGGSVGGATGGGQQGKQDGRDRWGSR